MSISIHLSRKLLRVIYPLMLNTWLLEGWNASTWTNAIHQKFTTFHLINNADEIGKYSTGASVSKICIQRVSYSVAQLRWSQNTWDFSKYLNLLVEKEPFSGKMRPSSFLYFLLVKFLVTLTFKSKLYDTYKHLNHN